EAQTMLDDARALTPKKFADAFKGSNSLISENGYQKLPSGLILQWGTFSATGNPLAGTQVNFPVTYPSQALSFVALGGNAETSSTPVSVWRNVDAAGAGLTPSGCSARTNAPAGTTVFWISMGK